MCVQSHKKCTFSFIDKKENKIEWNWFAILDEMTHMDDLLRKVTQSIKKYVRGPYSQCYDVSLHIIWIVDRAQIY